MLRVVGRRLLHAAVLVLAVSAACFVLAELVPGDFLAPARLDPRASAESLEALRARYGLDRPLHQRYLSWLGSVLRGEMGHSLAYGVPVAPLVLGRAGNTLLLSVPATALAWLLALILGAWGARRPGGWGDRLSLGLGATLQAVPELVLALLALLAAARSGIFPLGGMASLSAGELGFWGRLVDVLRHLALPALVLALALVPVLLRHVRAALSEALEQSFVHAARGHGVGELRLLLTYALPAAAPPLLALFGLSAGTLLSGSLVVEVVMSWPGLGPLLLDAVFARDLHVIVGATLLSGLLLVAGNLLADLLLYAVDPRLRRPGATP